MPCWRRAPFHCWPLPSAASPARLPGFTGTGRSPRAHPWLDDTLLVSPSPAFLATLPNGKLPDRQDFYRYGPDHAGRIRAWETAIAECGRFAAAVLGWMERPDPTLIEPI